MATSAKGDATMMRACSLILAFLVVVVLTATAQDQAEKPPLSPNLIIHTSFEDGLTPNALPEGWSRWGHDNGKFRSAVVEGGRTGKKCLMIAGEGASAVVFTNGVTIDRGKRYALRGWVRFEGEKGSRALIAFNYFHQKKSLGLLPDVAGVTSQQKGWQLQAKTDRADEVPDASLIYASCCLEGKGTAWFDDLELVAYDRKNLPEDFEARFGPSNLPAEFSVLQRSIGAWDTQTTIKPGVRVPDGLRSKGVQTIEWALGKKFIQGKHVDQPGNVEAMSLQTYDAQSGVFRLWYFDSFGNFPRSEATGQWDEDAKTLTYKGTEPEEVSVTTITRFVSPDRTEWQGVWRDKSGRILMEIEGTAARRK
jgi:hypothetical protein